MIEEDIKQKLQKIQQLEAELIDKKKAIRAAGIAQAQAIIDSLDIDVSELRFKSMGEGHVRVVAKRGVVAPKYRGPEGQTWSGRGRQPGWLVALLAEGHTLEEFAIAAQ